MGPSCDWHNRPVEQCYETTMPAQSIKTSVEGQVDRVMEKQSETNGGRICTI